MAGAFEVEDIPTATNVGDVNPARRRRWVGLERDPLVGIEVDSRWDGDRANEFSSRTVRGSGGLERQLNFPIDTLQTMLREAVAQRSQPVLRVIGDSAIALTLATMGSVAPESVWRQLRPRARAYLAILSQDIFAVPDDHSRRR